MGPRTGLSPGTHLLAENTNIGFVFSLLTAMGFLVGIILVYQILYTDVADHWSEYATLKAMGYSNPFCLGW
jgi:putative ABC transport system permease protein